MAGWVDSKEIDSNVALALIFSCILNVFLSPSLSFFAIFPSHTLFLDRSHNMKIHVNSTIKYFFFNTL